MLSWKPIDIAACALVSFGLLVAACGDSGSTTAATDGGSASSTGPGPGSSSSGAMARPSRPHLPERSIAG